MKVSSKLLSRREGAKKLPGRETQDGGKLGQQQTTSQRCGEMEAVKLIRINIYCKS